MSRKGVVKPIALNAYPTPPWAVHRLLEAVPGLPFARTWLEPAYGTGAICDAVDAWAASCGGRLNGATPRWVGVELAPQPSGMGMHLPSDRCVHYSTDYLKETGGNSGDFGRVGSGPAFSVAITNPDFSIAYEYARLMTQHARQTFLLTRLNILEAGKKARNGQDEARLKWLSRNEPDVYVLPDRPVFAHRLTCIMGSKPPNKGGCKGVMIAWDLPTPETIKCACWANTIPIAARPEWAPVFYRKASTDATGYCWLHWPELGRREGRLIHLAETPKAERVDRVIP